MTESLFAGPSASTEENKGPAAGRKPGIIRRYGSAIAIVVLFVAAGGVAAGIAAFRGPVTAPGLSNSAEEQAAADNVVLRAGDFPRPWRLTTAPVAPDSYGVGSVLANAAIVHSWVATHPSCSMDITTVSAALTASAASATAMASTQATATDPLGGSMQTTDVVAFHSSAKRAHADLAKLRPLLAEPAARSCIDLFWAAALLAGLPSGSQVSLSVSQPPTPALPGNPPVWIMSMGGIATVRGIALPFRFEVASFATGRAQVLFASSSKLVPLPLSLDQALLVVLATRAERQAS